MVEPQVRELFEQLASSEPPPSRVDIALARSRGRQRLRWRRAGLAAAPVLAAAAAAAVVLATEAAPGVPAQPGTTPAAGASPTAGPTRAPVRFNPLVPYASFGWLPAGQSLVSGGTGRAQLYLTAGPPGGAAYSLSLFSAGRCQLTAAPRQLTCAASATVGLQADVIGPAPTVRGHRSLWVSGYLAWEYARGGWAWLSFPAHGRRDALKVAAHIRYGATAPSIEFPAQLTGVPSRWQVSSVSFLPDTGVLRARQYALTAGAVAVSAFGGEIRMNVPFLTIDPATSHGSCPSYPGGRSTREVIGGYRVTVTHLPADRGNPPEQHLCAANAGGLAVLLSVNGRHPAQSVVTVFRNLRLLGTNPADWTTAPIG